MIIQVGAKVAQDPSQGLAEQLLPAAVNRPKVSSMSESPLRLSLNMNTIKFHVGSNFSDYFTPKCSALVALFGRTFRLCGMQTIAVITFLILCTPSNSQSENSPPFDPSSLIDKLGIAEVKKRAKSGDPKSQSAIGYGYLFGKSVVQDSTKAREWFLKAAEQGNSSAAFYLGGIYAAGNGADKNIQKAFSWYLKAAESGDDEAQVIVSDYYRAGAGVGQDLKKASDWLLKAAKLGNTTAMVKFARMSFSQDNESKHREAIEWLKQAAKTDASAKADLAYLYQNGRFTARDFVESYMWFYVLVNTGHEAYKEPIDKLQAQMHPADVSEARKRANVFLFKNH